MKDYKAHDNCIYMFRIMSALNRLAKYEGESLVIDEWLNLRGKYGVRITEHPDFEGVKLNLPNGAERMTDENDYEITLSPHKSGTDGFYIAVFTRKA